MQTSILFFKLCWHPSFFPFFFFPSSAHSTTARGIPWNFASELFFSTVFSFFLFHFSFLAGTAVQYLSKTFRADFSRVSYIIALLFYPDHISFLSFLKKFYVPWIVIPLKLKGHMLVLIFECNVFLDIPCNIARKILIHLFLRLDLELVNNLILKNYSYQKKKIQMFVV